MWNTWHTGYTGSGTVLVVTLLLVGCAAPIACQDPIVPALQRRIHEREKRIAELQIQLDTLKHIQTDVIDKKMSPVQ